MAGHRRQDKKTSRLSDALFFLGLCGVGGTIGFMLRRAFDTLVGLYS